MTQASLAAMVSPDMHARDIDALESGRILVPCWPLLEQLIQALVLTIDDLLDEVIEPARDMDPATSESAA